MTITADSGTGKQTSAAPVPWSLDRIVALVKDNFLPASLCAVLSVAIFIAAEILITKKYDATMVVAEVPDQLQGPLSQAGGGGVASAVARLKGLGGLGGESDEKLNQYLALLTSRQVATELAKEPWILQGVFNSEWDPETQSWKTGGIARMASNAVKSLIGYPAWHPPDGSRLARVLQNSLKTDQDLQTGFVTITYSNEDGDFAMRFLQALNAATDRIVRAAAIQTSTNRIRFLNQRLDKEEKADLRSGLIDTIGTEEHNLAMATSDPNYAALMIVKPYRNDRPSSPPLLIVVGFSVAAGAGALYLWILWKARGRQFFSHRS
ncbi:MAG TPA: hypothetical protein VHD95_06705 [Rhizomicrobium sp.]|jgi:hypothetical protein|nr:hypothetical protein [Rhizomicrobium sp.]